MDYALTDLWVKPYNDRKRVISSIQRWSRVVLSVCVSVCLPYFYLLVVVCVSRNHQQMATKTRDYNDGGGVGGDNQQAVLLSCQRRPWKRLVAVVSRACDTEAKRLYCFIACSRCGRSGKLTVQGDDIAVAGTQRRLLVLLLLMDQNGVE